MITEVDGRLTVRVRLLDEPCLWCWEIVDESGAAVESSWTTAWAAFESREEAEAAGQARCEELTVRGAA